MCRGSAEINEKKRKKEEKKINGCWQKPKIFWSHALLRNGGTIIVRIKTPPRKPEFSCQTVSYTSPE
jgi:hypothetical protein